MVSRVKSSKSNMEWSMELDLNVALPSDEQLSQEKLLSIKTPRDFDLNITLNEADCVDMNYITPSEMKNEIIIQSSPTEWNYSDHQASQILTKGQASGVGGSIRQNQAPDFAGALAEAARVYNKVEVSSDPELKLKRLVKIAHKPAPMPIEVQRSYKVQSFQLQQHPSSSSAMNETEAGSTNHDNRLENLKPRGVFRPFGYRGQML